MSKTLLSEIENINVVVKNNLCTGCGTCVSICPKEAIKLTTNEKKGIYVPEANSRKCDRCGICYKICPGHEVDSKGINLEIFGKSPEDILIGNYLNCYIGYANDTDIRYNSSSGGLVTQILIFALEKGIIDGALVTKMKKDYPLEPEPFIARTKTDIIEASKSKYCPVPANIALKEIINSNEGEKFAVVGLPCHIQGIRKAEQINKKLRDKIVLHLGLFCHHGANFICTDFFLEKMGVKKEKVARFRYRGQGWPGRTSIELGNDCKKDNPYSHYWIYPSLYLFTPNRCFMCSDALSELADISLGDAWLPELSADKIGNSIVVSRNGIGEELLQRAEKENKLIMQHTSKEKLIESQKPALYFKKKSLSARKRILQLENRYLPSDNASLLSANTNDYFIALFIIYLNNYISSVQINRKMLKLIPIRLMMFYQFAFYAIIKYKKLK